MANEIYEYVSALDGSQMDVALMDMAQHTSEAWAIGERNGLPVGTSDETYENNAKYYAEQAGRVVPEGQAAVRYDIAQTLIDSEKAQARSNINTPSDTELLDLKMLGWTVPKDFEIQNYKEDGVFHQRVGRVDLGTLSYTYNDTYAYFLSSINGRAYSNDINMYALLYTNIGDKSSVDMGTAPNMSIAPNNNNINFKLKNTSYATVAELKTALMGTYLYYELATEITRPIDGGEWGVKYSNPNLLDNPWFTVNQRGQSSYTWGGTVDRWNVGGGVFTVTPLNGHGVNIAKSAGNSMLYLHTFETARLTPNNTYTLSINIDGNIYSRSFIYDGGHTSAWYSYLNFYASGLRLRLLQKDTDTNYIEFRIDPENNANAINLNINSVKLELGSVSTLANDMPPNYATELLKCQRYLHVIPTTYLNGVAQTASVLNVAFTLPVPMRAVPTVTFSRVMVYTNTWTNITNIAAVYGTQHIALSLTGASFTAHYAYEVLFDNVILSAEL